MGQVISYTTTSVDIDLQDAGTLRGATISSPAGRPRPLPSNFSYSAPDGSPRDCTRFGNECEQPPMMAGDKVIGRSDTDIFSEDRLLLNIWVPLWREAKSWLARICLASEVDGGWLQIGNPCHVKVLNPVEHIAPVSTGGGGVRAIFIAVGYKVSILGFLAGQVLDSEGNKSGNYGMWDQRCALEWVHKNIHYFGGNNRLGGQSAGAYSAHAQLFHDLLRAPKTEGGLFHNVGLRVECNFFFSFEHIVDIVRYSNSIGVQPKQSEEVEVQYQSLLAACGIASTDPPSSQLSQLRAIPAAALVDKVNSLAQHTFHIVSDNDFFGTDLLGSYNDGPIRHRVQAPGDESPDWGDVAGGGTIRIPPRIWMASRLGSSVAERLIDEYLSNPTHLRATGPEPDPEVSSLEQIYGIIVADAQVRAPSRQLVAALRDGGIPLTSVRRYLISYRHSLLDGPDGAPPTWGVTHACDMPIFGFPTYFVMPEAERNMSRAWLRDLADMIAEEGGDFGTREWTKVKELTRDGTVAIVQDGRWADLERVAEIMGATTSRVVHSHFAWYYRGPVGTGLREAQIQPSCSESDELENLIVTLNSLPRHDIPFTCCIEDWDDAIDTPQIMDSISRNIPHTVTKTLQLVCLDADFDDNEIVNTIHRIRECLPRFTGLVYLGMEGYRPVENEVKAWGDACPMLEACS
ncbi:Alpha/Beta hydrolase protein [Mycena epipterygia]|nr:Alpha/Beta hydrolase protein [Mycena epipterygia]